MEEAPDEVDVIAAEPTNAMFLLARMFKVPEAELLLKEAGPNGKISRPEVTIIDADALELLVTASKKKMSDVEVVVTLMVPEVLLFVMVPPSICVMFPAAAAPELLIVMTGEPVPLTIIGALMATVVAVVQVIVPPGPVVSFVTAASNVRMSPAVTVRVLDVAPVQSMGFKTVTVPVPVPAPAVALMATLQVPRFVRRLAIFTLAVTGLLVRP